MGFKIRLLCLIWLFSSASKAQPIADFSAQQTSGCAPLIVRFNDESLGNPTEWTWDLGNGTTSFLQHPSVTYFNPGTYSITLTVKNNQGTSTVTKQAYITVFASPKVKFGSSDSSGCYPLTIQFTDSSQATQNNQIVSWLWDFGDGKFSTLQHPSHTYDTSGFFNVSLKVISGNGCSNSITKDRLVEIFDGIKANFEETDPSTCVPPAVISFADKSISTTAYDTYWNFGDGQTSFESNPVHTFSSNGIYSVTLIVTNSFGCKDSITKAGLVKLGRFTANFETEGNPCVNQPIKLINLSQPTPVSNKWDFGNGVTQTTKNGTVKYDGTGSYQVTLISDFGACEDTIIKTVKIYPKPTARFSSRDTLSCLVPYNVAFSNGSSGASQYYWTLSNQDTSYQIAQNTVISNAGSYSVKLVAINQQGCADSVEKSDYIRIQLPIAGIKNLPQSGCAPFSWNFDARISSIENVKNYSWDFGDGQTSTAINPVHVYDSGSYNVKLKIETIGGCVDSVEYKRAILVGKIPMAAFTALPTITCAKMPVAFTEEVQDSITRWFWKFGDGGSSTEANPSHLYQDTGKFDITLIAFNNGCSDTLIKEDYITILPPIARAEVEMDCNQKFTRKFKGEKSIMADSYHWNFGDGNTSTQKNPVHQYSQPGSYMVELTVTNQITGCDHVASLTVNIVDEKADFEIKHPEICKNENIECQTKGINPANIKSYLWDAGDGNTNDSSALVHKYSIHGNFNIKLMITDLNGCKDSITRISAVRVNGPTAAFTPEIPVTCFLTPTSILDQSSHDGLHPIVSWTINYGDNSVKTYTTGPFNHTYTRAGIYDVMLKVTDVIGCTDSIYLLNIVKVSRPVAAFSNATQNSCPGNKIFFTNKSYGNRLKYSWDFGDGSGSTIAAPWHIYQTTGSHTVSLQVTDAFGCTDSMKRVDYITIHQVAANFSMSDSVGSCPPLIVDFKNLTNSGVRYEWDFGDETSSQLINPSHFYATPGTYTVKLRAFTYGNCESTIEKKIIVNGPIGNFTYDPLSFCSPDTVHFKATTQNRDMIVWDFNDGNTLTTADSVVWHVYDKPGKYRPRIILNSVDGCKVAYYGKDTIFVKGADVKANINNGVICDSGKVTFINQTYSSETNLMYEWNFGDGEKSFAHAPQHFYNEPGTYSVALKVLTPGGCTDSLILSEPVKVSSSPKPVISPLNNGCVPLYVDLMASNNIFDSTKIDWTWHLGDGRTFGVKDSQHVIYPTAGDFKISLIARNGFGCADSTQKQVQAFALPKVSAGKDSFNCYQQGIRLNATGAERYIWNASVNLSCVDCHSPFANPDSIETYVVTGFNNHGCLNTDTVVIDVVYPFQMTVSNGDTLCKGETLLLQAQGADHYTWNPDVHSISQNNSLVTVKPDLSVSYSVTGKDKFNCFSKTMEVPVSVFPVPEVNAGEDITLNIGGSVKLTPKFSSDVTEVFWSPTEQVMRSEYPSITVKPKETTVYTVDVYNPGKCHAKDEVKVTVTCDGNNVFIPNTFSPNGDGMNDVFYPRGTGLFRIKSMKIYNRWGQMVFQKNDLNANDINAGWRGNFGEQPLNSDVFVYVIELICDNNTSMILKGDVTLLK